jgi:hypothetical protein
LPINQNIDMCCKISHPGRRASVLGYFYLGGVSERLGCGMFTHQCRDITLHPLQLRSSSTQRWPTCLSCRPNGISHPRGAPNQSLQRKISLSLRCSIGPRITRITQSKTKRSPDVSMPLLTTAEVTSALIKLYQARRTRQRSSKAHSLQSPTTRKIYGTGRQNSEFGKHDICGGRSAARNTISRRCRGWKVGYTSAGRTAFYKIFPPKS